MTPQDLRNSILQLAIQGKLVEQRPEEGTGEDLYQQIQAEKQKMILEGTIKREKPVPEITEDEIPYEIPESWKWVRVGDVFSIINGFTPSRANPDYWNNGNIPWFTAEDIRNQGRVIRYTRQSINSNALGEQSKRIVPAKSVLLCCTASIGEYAISEIALTTNQQFNALVVKPEYNNFISYKFVFYYSATLKVPLMAVAGVTTFPFVSVKKLSSFLFPFPPFSEQQRIVAKIEELFPLISRYEQVWSRLESVDSQFPDAMRKSILQMAIQGKLVEQRPAEGTGEELYQQIQAEKQRLILEGKIKKDKPVPEITEDEIPFEIPKSWKWVRFGSVISLLSGVDFSPDNYNDTMVGIPYITGASSLSNDGVIISRWTPYPRVIAKKGDVLIVCKGSGYGKVVLCDVEEAHIARQIMAIRKFDSISMKYILFFLKSCVTTIKASGQGVIPGIDRNTILNLAFPLPPFSEQQRIVSKIEELLPFCDMLK